MPSHVHTVVFIVKQVMSAATYHTAADTREPEEDALCATQQINLLSLRPIKPCHSLGNSMWACKVGTVCVWYQTGDPSFGTAQNCTIYRKNNLLFHERSVCLCPSPVRLPMNIACCSLLWNICIIILYICMILPFPNIILICNNFICILVHMISSHQY